MSTFEVKVVQVRSIEPIPAADAIELAVIGEYRSVVKKGEYFPGSYAVYIPEASLIPAMLLEKMGLTGKLAGSDKNRVKAIRLRGCLSQGILYPVYCTNPFAYGGIGQYEIELGIEEDYSMTVKLGDDVAQSLGITKWEPPIPVNMSGDVYNAGQHITYNYDIENFKWHPEVLQDGEEVQFTEKLHGCADYDTIIDTVEYGLVKIGDLVERKLTGHVKSMDVATNEIQYNQILGWSVQDNINNWFEVELVDGSSVRLTGNHLVWLPELKAYRAVDELVEGDVVLID